MENTELLTSEEAEKLAKQNFNYFVSESNKLKEINPEYYNQVIYPIYEKYLNKRNLLDLEIRQENARRSNFKILYVILTIIGGVVIIYFFQNIVLAPDYSNFIDSSITNIYNDYKENPINADIKYKGKMVKITGKIYGFKNVSGEYQIELTENNGNFLSSLFGKIAVCNISRKYSLMVPQLRKGEKITIIGYFQEIETEILSATLTLNNCAIKVNN